MQSSLSILKTLLAIGFIYVTLLIKNGGALPEVNENAMENSKNKDVNNRFYPLFGNQKSYYDENSENFEAEDEDSEENLHNPESLARLMDYYKRVARRVAFSAWAGKRSSDKFNDKDEYLLKQLYKSYLNDNEIPSKKAFSSWAGKRSGYAGEQPLLYDRVLRRPWGGAP